MTAKTMEVMDDSRVKASVEVPVVPDQFVRLMPSDLCKMVHRLGAKVSSSKTGFPELGNHPLCTDRQRLLWRVSLSTIDMIVAEAEANIRDRHDTRRYDAVSLVNGKVCREITAGDLKSLLNLAGFLSSDAPSISRS